MEAGKSKSQPEGPQKKTKDGPDPSTSAEVGTASSSAEHAEHDVPGFRQVKRMSMRFISLSDSLGMEYGLGSGAGY